MKLDLSADHIFFGKKRNKSQNTKLQLSVLATEARTGIDENNQLTSSIIILKRLVKNNKKTLNKLISYNQISKKEVQKDLNDEKNEILLLNKNLKGERNLLKLKYSKTRNEINQILSNLKTELNILENRKFIYQNALIEKEANIKKIKNDIKLLCKSPYPLIKEDQRETFLNNIDSETLFNELLEIEQIELMVECKNFNKYQNKYIALIDHKNLLLDERRNLLKNKNKQKNLENIYEYMEKLGEEDSILNESITSVVEDDYNNTQFPIVINNKCIINKNNLVKKFKMPKLTVNQIIYNKKRIKPEDAEKSLSRIIVNKPTSKDLKIKKLKENIKKLKKKNEIKELRCKEFEKKIKKMQEIIENYSFVNEKKFILKNEITQKERPYINFSQ